MGGMQVNNATSLMDSQTRQQDAVTKRMQALKEDKPQEGSTSSKK